MSNKRYGEIIREKMQSNDNKQGHPVTIRMLERSTQYTYEHIRKVVKGMPVVSEELNQLLCDILGLDAQKMWSIAEKEKAKRKFASGPVAYIPPSDQRFRDIWPRLTQPDIERLFKIAEGMALMNESQGLVRKAAVR